jgi:L-phenylalanine/L-methionine N-acetyltransferase
MTRSATSKDFTFFYNLYMHPEVNPFLLYENMTTQLFEPVFNELVSNDVLYVFEMENKPVGMFKLINLKHRNAHIAYLGGVAIDPMQSGKGYGALMMQEIIDLGKSKGLLRIELSTAVGNQKAIRLYEKCGFKKEGVLQKYTHLKSENKFVDEVMMAYLYS